MCYENCVNSGELSARKGGDNPERSQVIYGILRKWGSMFSRGKNKGQEKAGIRAKPSNYPQGYFKEKKCKECGSGFTPQAPSHLYCSGECSSVGFTRKYLRKQYGITYEEYMDMYNLYDKRCHICKRLGFRIDKHHQLDLAVDHCHSTGVVRGMLCHNCNRGLGLFQDNAESLLTAVDYLKRATTKAEACTPEAIAGGSAQPLNTEGEEIV